MRYRKINRKYGTCGLFVTIYLIKLKKGVTCYSNEFDREELEDSHRSKDALVVG